MTNETQCPCCKESVPTDTLTLDVDGITGEKRGLICQPCDTFFGKFNHDGARIQRLARYRLKHNM